MLFLLVLFFLLDLTTGVKTDPEGATLPPRCFFERRVLRVRFERVKRRAILILIYAKLF